MQFYLIFDSLTKCTCTQVFCLWYILCAHSSFPDEKKNSAEKKNIFDSIESESVSTTCSSNRANWNRSNVNNSEKRTHTHMHVYRNEVKTESQSSKWKLMQSTCQCSIKYEIEFISKTRTDLYHLQFYKTAAPLISPSDSGATFFCSVYRFISNRYL